MLQLNRNQVALDLGRGQLFGGLAESGLEADLGIRALENALRQQQYKGLFDLLAAERAGQSGGTQADSGFRFYDVPGLPAQSDPFDVKNMVSNVFSGIFG